MKKYIFLFAMLLGAFTFSNQSMACDASGEGCTSFDYVMGKPAES